MVCAMLPLSQTKVYIAVPPDGFAIAVPSFWPNADCAVALALAAKIFGCVMMAEMVEEQFSASVTTTTYVPTARPVMLAVVLPLLQRYVYAPFPPMAVAVAAPFEPPLQSTFDWLSMDAATAALCARLVEAVCVQPDPVLVTRME